ncbi:hypothetical protein BJX61DRAFT_543356 [Aspergillus egyptiacus]|nr:hypothetical protein BJX61DRAFT_543356 [Aspergillus egyptiacus]
METGLLDLPHELVENIASFLTLRELHSFRLTCRYTARSTVYYYTRTYFRTVKTDLSSHSFAKLKALSQNDQFAGQIKTLVFTRPAKDRNPGQGSLWDRDGVGELVLPPQGMQEWQDILNRLPNCQSFRTVPSDLDYTDDYNRPIPSDALTLMFQVAYALKLMPDLAIDVGFGTNLSPVSLSRICARPPGQLAVSGHTWSRVRALYLFTYLRTELQTSLAFRLIERLTDLQDLRIYCPLGAMGNALVDRVIFRSFAFQLRRFTLYNAWGVSGEALKAFLYQQRHTLRHLRLESIYLTDARDWAGIFRALDAEFHALRHVFLDDIGQNAPCITIEFAPGHEGCVPSKHQLLVASRFGEADSAIK